MAETLTRRSFLKGLIAGVATVAIATKLAPALPKTEATFYAHKRYSVGWADARGVYGTTGEKYAEALAQSMVETKERVAANVLNKAFTPNPYLTDPDSWYIKAEAERILDDLPWEPTHLKAEHLVDYIEGIEDAQA